MFEFLRTMIATEDGLILFLLGLIVTMEIDDGYFQRFLDSQGWDDKAILASVQKMEAALTAQAAKKAK